MTCWKESSYEQKKTTAVDGSRSGGFRHEQTWTFADDGTVTLRNVTEPHGTMPKQLPRFVQALHYSLEDLDRARHGSREGRYRTRLEPRAETFLNLDIRQCGLGGASCGPKPMDKYLFPAQREEWTLFLSPAGEENRE